MKKVLSNLLISVLFTFLARLVFAEVIAVGLAALIGVIAGVAVPYMMVVSITAIAVFLYYAYALTKAFLAYRTMQSIEELFDDEEF